MFSFYGTKHVVSNNKKSRLYYHKRNHKISLISDSVCWMPIDRNVPLEILQALPVIPPIGARGADERRRDEGHSSSNLNFCVEFHFTFYKDKKKWNTKTSIETLFVYLYPLIRAGLVHCIPRYIKHFINLLGIVGKVFHVWVLMNFQEYRSGWSAHIYYL